MSWDRDEMADMLNSMEAIVDRIRDSSDTLDSIHRKNGGDDPYSFPGSGSGNPGSRPEPIDVASIRAFTEAVKDATPPMRLFGRALDILQEKIVEAIRAGSGVPLGAGSSPMNGTAMVPYIQTPGRGGSGGGPPGSGPGGAGGSPGGGNSWFNAFQQNNLTQNNLRQWQQINNSSTMNVFTAPSNKLTGKERRMRNRHRRYMRNLMSKRALANTGPRVLKGIFYGGTFGGMRGAARGALTGALTGNLGASIFGNPAVLAAGIAAMMPTIMAATANATEFQMDKNRAYSIASPETTSALVNYDVNNMFRGMELAKASTRTAVNLIDNQDRLRESMMPYEIMSRNVGNTTSSFMASMGSAFFDDLAGVFRTVNGAVDNDAVQNGVDKAGRVAGHASSGAMIGAAIGLLTIPVLGWFGPLLGGAVGSLFGAAAGIGSEAGAAPNPRRRDAFAADGLAGGADRGPVAPRPRNF